MPRTYKNERTKLMVTKSKLVTAESVKSIEHRKYLTIQDAAQYLDVSPLTIRNLIKEKKLKSLSTGKYKEDGRYSNIRIRRTDLDKLLKEIKL